MIRSFSPFGRPEQVKLTFILVTLMLLNDCVLSHTAASISSRRALAQLDYIETALGEKEQRAELVSSWSSYQQIEHLLLAHGSILDLVETNKPLDEQTSITLLGRLVLLTGHIPRGRGKAPTPTAPVGKPRPELEQLLAGVRYRLGSLDLNQVAAQSEPVGLHPHFGGLTPRQWLRFIAVHGNHHMKIIKAILEQGKVN